MVKIQKICYCKKFNVNRKFQLIIGNKTNVCIQFIIQFSMGSKTITKKSRFITKDQSANLVFTSSATNIYFNVLNCSLATKPLICNHTIPIPADTYYEIQGTDAQPVCVQIY